VRKSLASGRATWSTSSTSWLNTNEVVRTDQGSRVAVECYSKHAVSEQGVIRQVSAICVMPVALTDTPQALSTPLRD